jgi:N-acetylglucosaminylphosphatidylinositol deacetylase
VLLVIAHPDDEAMFFTPLLLRLKELQCFITILCLSSGNAYGEGEVRSKELIASASIFGIETQSVVVLVRDFMVRIQFRNI